MPVLIDAPGEYRARNGRLIIIHEVQNHKDNLEITKFNCKGHTLIPKKDGKGFLRMYDIWHESGAWCGVFPSSTDIVSKIS